MSALCTLRHFEVTEKTIFMTDLDGTVLPLLADPAMRRVDKDALLAFEMFNAKYPGQVIPITGRDYEQVVQCFGGKPSFPVISSNGGQLHMPDGREYTYRGFNENDMLFIAEMREAMDRFQKTHPWLVTEVKRMEIGYHSSKAHGYWEEGADPDTISDKVRSSAEEARVLLSGLQMRAKRLGLDFVLSGAEQTHHALSHAKVDKLGAIGWFNDILPQLPSGDDWSHIVYCGDSLLRGQNGLADGNDRQIASIVRQKGGIVIQVTNEEKRPREKEEECARWIKEGKEPPIDTLPSSLQENGRVPDPNDDAEPVLVVRTPNQLGNLLRRKVESVMRRKSHFPPHLTA